MAGHPREHRVAAFAQQQRGAIGGEIVGHVAQQGRRVAAGQRGGHGPHQQRRRAEAFDRQAVLRADTLYTFDNLVTAPLHGFRDTDDYWLRASSAPHLPAITVPTLVLNARNDPFLEK